MSESVFRHIMKHESQMSQNERGGVGAQTDIISINFLISGTGN
jgi:hypothetical protein